MKRKIITGLGWLGLLRIIAQVIVFVKLSVLTHILTPTEFGLFAIVTTIVNSIEAFTETGFDYAVIYFKDDLSKYARTLLAANALRGFILSLFIVFSSNLLGNFFNNSDLPKLLLLSSVIPLLGGFENPYVVLFNKNLDFHKEFLYRGVPLIIGALASIFFGVLLKNTTGLVYGLLVGSLSQVIFSYIITKNDFSEPIKLSFIKKLFSYGKWMTLGGVIAYFNTQIDNIFVGKFYGAHTLGLYDIAFKLSHIITSEVTDTLAKVLFPYFSKIQEDSKKVKKYFFLSIALLAIPAGVMVILFNLIPVFILKLFFGNQWTNAAPLLTILSYHGFLQAVIGPAGPLFLSVGKPKILTIMSFINFILVISLITILSTFIGIKGVAWGMTISYIITTLIFIVIVKSHFKNNS